MSASRSSLTLSEVKVSDVFREANRKLDQFRRELTVEGERFPFICECNTKRCTELILVRPHEYEAVRSHPRRFLVVDGHDPDSRVVSRHDGFAVVEKDGREAELGR